MPSWPVDLPEYPVLKSVKVGSPQNVVKRTQMSVGPAKVRRLQTTGYTPLTATFAPLTEVDIGTFETWFQTTVAMGTLPFDMTHPVSDATITCRFASENQPYSIQERGRDHYAVTLNLEIAP